MGYLFDLYLSQDEKDILEESERFENGVHSTDLLSKQLSASIPNATATNAADASAATGTTATCTTAKQ